MQLNNMTSLREMLEQLTTEQLDEMLQKELHKDTIDDHAARLIMRILREREENHPVEMTLEIEQAWEKYKRDVTTIGKDGPKRSKARRWVLRASSIAAILCLVVLMFPQQAGAETFWERLTRWTESIVEFFSPSDNEGRIQEYEFKTDNPGLQQVYDVVVELGITDPVVPMWLPEGYELVEIETTDTPRKEGLNATFERDGAQTIYFVNKHVDEIAHSYHKDDTRHEEFERNGFTFYIAQNNDRWVAIWTKDNIECFLTIDCQEDTIHEILRSIYVMEE